MRWKREDTGYAVAALLAAIVVAYFIVANFGLLPSPLPSSDSQPLPRVGVPRFDPGRAFASTAPPVFATKPAESAPVKATAIAGHGASIDRAGPVSVSTADPHKPTGGAVSGTAQTVGAAVDTVGGLLRALLGNR